MRLETIELRQIEVVIGTSRLSQEVKQTFRSLRHRNFRLYYIGQMISLTGTWMQNVALSWLVYRLTHSPVWLGVMECASHLPMLVFGLLAGWVADHYGRRRTIMITQSLAMVQASILAFLTLTHQIQIWHAIVLAIFAGTANAFELPSRQAFLVDLIDKEDLVNAVSLNSSLFNAARFIGPAMAGYIVFFAGEGFCFLLNALSYAAVLIALASMHVPDKAEVHEHGEPKKSIGQAFSFVVESHQIRPVILLIFFITLFGVQYSVLLPVMAAEVLHGGVATLGNLRACGGLGALCAALTLANRGSGSFLTRGIGYAAVALAVGLFCFGLSKSVAVSLLLMLAVGFCNVSLLSGSHSLVQLAVTDSLRGRVMSIYMMIMLGINPVGSMAVGCAAARFGAPNTVMFCAGASLIAGVFYLVMTARRKLS